MSQSDQPQETLADANRRKLQYLEDRVEQQNKQINRLESAIRMLESELGEEALVSKGGES